MTKASQKLIELGGDWDCRNRRNVRLYIYICEMCHSLFFAEPMTCYASQVYEALYLIKMRDMENVS